MKLKTVFAQSRPQIVLLDIGMPRRNGYEVARWIRAQPGGAEVVLAAITGWGQTTDKTRAEEAGFDRHFTKPIDYADLNTILGTAIEPRAAGVIP
jgi:CheY-like chemotaxis protein